jgi:hypothetical protein
MPCSKNAGLERSNRCMPHEWLFVGIKIDRVKAHVSQQVEILEGTRQRRCNCALGRWYISVIIAYRCVLVLVLNARTGNTL